MIVLSAVIAFLQRTLLLAMMLFILGRVAVTTLTPRLLRGPGPPRLLTTLPTLPSIPAFMVVILLTPLVTLTLTIVLVVTGLMTLFRLHTAVRIVVVATVVTSVVPSVVSDLLGLPVLWKRVAHRILFLSINAQDGLLLSAKMMPLRVLAVQLNIQLGDGIVMIAMCDLTLQSLAERNRLSGRLPLLILLMSRIMSVRGV